MAGTKQIRIGKLVTEIENLIEKRFGLMSLRKETTIPTRQAYYDGRIDMLTETIERLQKVFSIGDESGT